MNFNNILKSSGIAQNHEGATAYELTPEMGLYTAVVTMALQDKFYEAADAQVDRVAQLIRCKVLGVVRDLVVGVCRILRVVEDNLVHSVVFRAHDQPLLIGVRPIG